MQITFKLKRDEKVLNNWFKMAEKTGIAAKRLNDQMFIVQQLMCESDIDFIRLGSEIKLLPLYLEALVKEVDDFKEKIKPYEDPVEGVEQQLQFSFYFNR